MRARMLNNTLKSKHNRKSFCLSSMIKKSKSKRLQKKQSPFLQLTGYGMLEPYCHRLKARRY